MKKIGIFIEVLLIFAQIAPGMSFAQVRSLTATPTPQGQQINQTPTPTPTKIAPTGTPTLTITPTTTPITATPTPHAAQPTSTPATQTLRTTEGPTPTPQIVSPLASYTVTPTPKPVALTTRKKTPPPPVSKLITAPFDLAMNVLPKSYYNDQGLTPSTTKMLLLLSLLFILSGTILLTWPSLVKIRSRIFVSPQREKRTMYIHNGKGLLKA